MHKKVHGSGIYILLTYTYPILSELAAPFCDPSSIPSFLPHDKDLYSRRYRRTRPDYDDKYLYSRRYMRNRHDYDDKFLYSRRYMRNRHDYDDKYLYSRR